MNGIAKDGLAKQRFDRPAIHDVAGAAKQIVDVKFQPGVLKQAHRAIGIEVDQNVDIAIGPGFSPLDGAEHGGVRDAALPQFHFVSLQGLQYGVQRFGHSATRLYQNLSEIGGRNRRLQGSWLLSASGG